MRGDMQQNADVAQLNILLAKEKAEFQATRAALREALASANAPEDIDERLMAYADEFGTDSAVLMLRRSPKTFDIEGKVGRKAIAAAAPKIENLVLSNRDMAGLVVRRENILVAQDPAHNRVYIDRGKEFTISMVGGQLVERAKNGEIQKLDVVKEDGVRAKKLRKVWKQEEEQSQEQGQEQ